MRVLLKMTTFYWLKFVLLNLISMLECKNCEFTWRTYRYGSFFFRYGALRMTTISNRWPNEGQCGLPPSFRHDIVWIIRRVAAMFSQFFTFLPRQTHLSPNVPEYFSQRILQDFERFPKSFDWKYYCYTCFEGIHQAKCFFTFSNYQEFGPVHTSHFCRVECNSNKR